MNKPLVFRVISDLHWGHSGSMVKEPSCLKPLFEGTEKVIFNGDTIEMKDGPGLSEAALGEKTAALHEVVKQGGAEMFLVTGNHDPFVRGPDLCRELGDRLMITHGDCIFSGLTPWSRDADDLQQFMESILARSEVSGEDPAIRVVAAAREAYRRLFTQLDRHAGARFGTLQLYLRQLWPPFRPISILHYWRKTPQLAAHWIERFAPEADFFFIGHTHRPGCWELPRPGRPPLVLVNTGCFIPYLGRLCIDCDGESIRVRKIPRRQGIFHPGQEIAAWPLTRD